MHRLLVETAMLSQEMATLPKEAARHLKVLRPKPDEEIELFDGHGHTRRYAYTPSGLRTCGDLSTFQPSAFQLVLFACVTKGSRWDWTIEKAVELGATRIVPVISDRCIVRLDPSEREAKAERWRRVAEDAARQSDAIWLPEVLAPVDFSTALSLVKTSGHVFVGALTNPPPPPLISALAQSSLSPNRTIEQSPQSNNNPLSFGMFVGPEGDFTPAELSALLEIATPVSFGPTVLRAETAAIFGLSVLAAHVHQS